MSPRLAKRPSRAALRRCFAAVCVLLGCAAFTSAARAADTNRFFGISAPELYSMSLDGRFELRDRALRVIERSGIDAVRTEIGWRDVEPQAPIAGIRSLRWAGADRHVLALAEHSQTLVPMMLAPPAWAQRADSAAACQRRGMVAPEHVDDYAAFTAAVARRYGRDGAFWRWAAAERPDLPQRPITTYEIWNEPNWDAFSCPAIDPETYAAALSAAADAIHSVDPAAQVTIGGLVLLDVDTVSGERQLGMATATFLERMVAAHPELPGRVDAVALHTYRATPADNLDAIGWAQDLMERVGLGSKRLVISELGWHTSGSENAVAEAERARMLAEYTNALTRTDCPIDSIFPHNWITARANPADREHWFGLADPETAEPLPSGTAYASTVQSAESGDLRPLGTLEVCTAATAEPPTDPSPDPKPRRLVLKINDAPGKRAGRRPAIRFTVRGDAAARVRMRLDGRRSRFVRSPVRLPRLSTGRHVVRLRATAPGAIADRRTVRFRVVRGR